jgi:hypothetical protein
MTINAQTVLGANLWLHAFKLRDFARRYHVTELQDRRERLQAKSVPTADNRRQWPTADFPPSPLITHTYISHHTASPRYDVTALHEPQPSSEDSAAIFRSEVVSSGQHCVEHSAWRTRFPFRRLPRLAGLRWRYSNPPPHALHQHCSPSQGPWGCSKC